MLFHSSQHKADMVSLVSICKAVHADGVKHQGGRLRGQESDLLFDLSEVQDLELRASVDHVKPAGQRTDTIHRHAGHHNGM